MKKGIRKIITVFAVVCLLCVGLFYWYVSDYYHADGSVQEYLVSDETVTVVKEDGWISFETPSADTGIIFYPGAKVEAISYAPLMRGLAEKGINAYLVQMPFNLAFFGISSADRIIHDDLSHWYLCGHSLGGSMAAYYVEGKENIDGLILLASYAANDLSDTDLSVLSVYGSEDGVLNMQKYEANRVNLPEDTVEIIISGGNHAGFAYYGPQENDHPSLISADEQISDTIEVIADFIG